MPSEVHVSSMEEAVTSRRELLLLPLGPKRGQCRRVKRRIGRSLASFMLGSCRVINLVEAVEVVEGSWLREGEDR